MDTTTLRVLICSNNEETVRQMSRILSGRGGQIQASELFVDHLYFSRQEWDYIVVDLDGLDIFLHKLLLVFFQKFPNLPRIGVLPKSAKNVESLARSVGLELDAYLSEIPQPEDLIVLFPQVADKYLCDSATLNDLIPSSLNVFKTKFNHSRAKLDTYN